MKFTDVIFELGQTCSLNQEAAAQILKFEWFINMVNFVQAGVAPVQSLRAAHGER